MRVHRSMNWVNVSVIGSILVLSATLANSQESSRFSARSSDLEAAPKVLVKETPGTAETPHNLRIHDSAFVSAYGDIVRILQDKNNCSDFFGGPMALEAFGQLGARLRKTFIDQKVGIRMFGDYTIFMNAASSFRYRVFQKAEINGRGAFFRPNKFQTELRIQDIGNFPANTREARVLMLLHELGHMIQTSPGHWLLRDDGNDEWQSKENTRTVEKHCEQVIRAKR